MNQGPLDRTGPRGANQGIQDGSAPRGTNQGHGTDQDPVGTDQGPQNESWSRWTNPAWSQQINIISTSVFFLTMIHSTLPSDRHINYQFDLFTIRRKTNYKAL